MRRTLLRSLSALSPPSLAYSPNSAHKGWAARILDAFLLLEVPWAFSCVLLVYIPYLVTGSYVYPWLALALVLLPYPARLLRRKAVFQRTPFDLPMALIFLGACIGFWVSPERSMSLWPLQCTVVLMVCYYTLVIDENKPIWMRLMLVLLVVSFVTVLALILAGVTQVYNSTGTGDTNHGLASQLAAAGAVLLGVAIFSRSGKVRIITAIVFAGILAAVIIMTYKSLDNLAANVSIPSRYNKLWVPTMPLLGDSPFTGLGLGCWAWTFYGGSLDLSTAWATKAFSHIYGCTHPHNGYIELYSNMGILGALGLTLTIIVGARLIFDMLHSSRTQPWYGLGVGVTLACIVTLLVAFVESAPVGQPRLMGATYYYVLSPLAAGLCALLAIAHEFVVENA